MRSPRPRRLARVLLVLPLLAAALTGTAAAAAAAVPTPPTPDRGAAIEDMPTYQPQTFCDPTDKPGVVAFQQLLLTTYPSTSSYGISRPCASEAGTSEHKDGRALDWHVSVTSATDKAMVSSVFHWLFATDAYGNKDAMLRRLGIMYIIWNKQIWGSWSQSWQPYACSGVTACHQDHVHFSFDWAGALRRTSYWTGVVSPVVPPQYPIYDSYTKPISVTVPARASSVSPVWSLRAGHHYTVTVTGQWHYARLSTTVADAQCHFRAGRWTSGSAAGVLTGFAAYDGPQRWRSAVAPATACNLRTHTYQLTITPTVTEHPTLSILDTGRSDDSGALTVTFLRVH